jgi:HK97 family phage portal protein
MGDVPMSLLTHLQPLALAKRDMRAEAVNPAVVSGAIMGPASPSTLMPLDNLEDQLRTYRVSSLIYRCASIWSEEAIQAPLRIYRRQGRSLGAEVVDGPVWDLLGEVNGVQAWPEFLYVTILNLALAGNAYWWKVRNRAGRVIELWSLKPSEVQIARDDFARFTYHWTPSDIGTQRYTFEESSIVHLRLPSPLDDVHGMSPVRPASDDIRADQQAKRSTLAMLDNSSLPIGTLTTEQDLTEDQAGELRRSWRQIYGGPANTGRIAVLGRGAKFVPISVQPKDLEYLNQRKLSRSGIINAFGIPPIYVGVESENFGNRREQRRQLWQDKLVPIFRLLEGQITERLLRDFDPSYVAVLDESRVDVFVEILGEQIETASKAVGSRLMVPNEARRIFISPFLRDVQGPVVGGEDFIAPMSMVPVSAIMAGETLALLNRDRQDPVQGVPAVRKAAVSEWDAYRAAQAPHEQEVYGVALPLLLTIIGMAIEQVTDGVMAEPSIIVPPSLLVESLLTNGVHPLFVQTAQAGFRHGRSQVGALTDAVIEGNAALFSRVAEARLHTSMPFVTETIRQRILETLLAGLHAGDASDAIRNRLDELSVVFAPGEAARIAGETGAVMNAASVEAYRQSGVIDEKRWLTSRDQFVRPAGRVGAFNHVAAEGQIVPVDQPFIVSGQQMMYPMDMSLGASVGNRANCRCAVAPVPRRTL